MVRITARLPFRRLLGLATVVAIATSGCGSGATGAPELDRAACRVRTKPSAPSRDDAVTEVRVTLVDHTRATPAMPGRAARPCRVLPTVIWLPAASTPQPLIVMAHGLDGDPDALGDLAATWARAGYVVAAPMFPVTVKDTDGRSASSEPARQAGDLRFVIDRVLAGDRDPSSPWSGRVDPAHIGAAGMSLGGLAVYASTTETCCTDPRIDAAVLMAAVHRDVPDSDQHPNRVPMMLLQGDADPGYHNSRDTYTDLVAPKWLVTLHGARHAPPFENPRGPEAQVVDPATTGFWALTLRGDAAGALRIRAAVREHPTTTTLRSDLGRGKMTR